ncbi:reverse transcriptase [Cucumis melo var. makuwa]|uniref:Reverse transcriptase n=1 Tax=Cucumis melo var. makuwa TaxID=1194695 RepID=A0A5A7U8Y2_CUCMM|nr:reverse transcriptase [Cucumis melo var. makuwa]TYK07797.1 reverse transcriptase [Cucumis melo var. makuwa]
MEVTRSKECISLSQRKYTLDLLTETSKLGCCPADTPIEFNCKLGNSGDQVPIDKKQYQRHRGQFMQAPYEKHMEAINKIMRYLKTTPDIFSRKRQKLRQFIQNMSFRGTGESYEKGYGVISRLLSRLIPQRNHYKNEPDSPQFNNNLEKIQKLRGRCYPRLDYEHHLNNSLSPCRLNNSRGRSSFHSDFSTNSNDNNFQVKYRTKEFDCDVDRKMTLLDVNGSPLTAAVENYRSFISSLFNPQYSLYDQDEHLHLRKQKLEPLLLGWDTDYIKDESSSQLTELNTFAKSPISFADDHQPTLHESFGAVALCSSPFPSSNRINFNSLPYSNLASYQIQGLSWQNVSKEEDIDATFNNLHLNFSSVPKCLHQCNSYVDDGGCHDLCAQNADWVMNNVVNDESQHPSVESLCASGLVFDFGWKYLSGSKEQCQTSYHILKYPLDEIQPTALINEEWSNDSSDDVLVDYGPPFYIQPESFFQEGKVYSVLTDKLSCWDVVRSEINVDDITEMNYK